MYILDFNDLKGTTLGHNKIIGVADLIVVTHFVRDSQALLVTNAIFSSPSHTRMQILFTKPGSTCVQELGHVSRQTSRSDDIDRETSSR